LLTFVSRPTFLAPATDASIPTAPRLNRGPGDPGHVGADAIRHRPIDTRRERRARLRGMIRGSGGGVDAPPTLLAVASGRHRRHTATPLGAESRMTLRTRMSRERTRRRWRLIWRGVLVLVAAAVFAGIGYSSYRTGSLLARLDVTALQADVDRLTGDLQTLRAENSRLQGDLAQTRQTADALRRRYDADVPSGGLAGLVDLVRQRLRDGLPQDRLAEVLHEAASTRSCDGPPIRKRIGRWPGGGRRAGQG
jgi:outer membrane murein-binding lipoprotein Lpp